MKRIISKNSKLTLLLLPGILFLSSFILFINNKPSFYIIGDSTVKNGQGNGGGGLWGWGDFIEPYMDTTRIKVENDALGGTSSRTFQNKGLWNKVLVKIKKGDYVIMQFGHNDAGPLDDTARARGTIKGIGNETKQINNPITKQMEMVHTYGWYLEKYIDDILSRGGIPIVCSPIPRNDWKEGKVLRSADSYAKWAKEVSTIKRITFIDLNNLIAEKYEALGQEKVKSFFPVDHTHTNIDGAKLNAEIVIMALKSYGPKNLMKFFMQ